MKVAPLTGLEPAISSLTARRGLQLLHKGIFAGLEVESDVWKTDKVFDVVTSAFLQKHLDGVEPKLPVCGLVSYRLIIPTCRE
jgi:hypothetical protein